MTTSLSASVSGWASGLVKSSSASPDTSMRVSVVADAELLLLGVSNDADESVEVDVETRDGVELSDSIEVDEIRPVASAMVATGANGGEGESTGDGKVVSKDTTDAGGVARKGEVIPRVGVLTPASLRGDGRGKLSWNVGGVTTSIDLRSSVTPCK